MNTSASTKILVISDDSAAATFILDTFTSLSRYEVGHVPMSALAGLGKADRARFDMIVLDVDGGEVLARPELFEFRTRFRDVPLVVISQDLADTALRQLFRLNGNDWLKKPLERRSLIDLILTHAPGSGAGNSRVHAVVSAVGGAGASVIAASLARTLAQPVKGKAQQVNLFDLDFASGSQGLYLDMQNDYDLRQVLGNPSRVDLEFIDLVKKRHESGFSLLSFKYPSFSQVATSSELVLRMLDVIAFESDHTVVDIPYYDTPWKFDVLGSVNSIYIVTELTIPALRQAKELISQLVDLRGNQNSIYVVVNKYRSKIFGFGLPKRQVSKVFKDTSAHFVTEDWDTLSEALNRGVLPHDVNARSGFCSGVGKLGELVK